MKNKCLIKTTMSTINSRLDTEKIKFLNRKRNSRIFPEIKAESTEIKMEERIRKKRGAMQSIVRSSH